ncbi:MAG: hypothetical protein ACK4VZ_11565 [Paracoccaceae bacterium]
MAALIDAARVHDAQLRNILSDPRLLGAGREDRGLFHRRAPGTYKTIAQAADAYCRKFWGHGVCAVIFARCPEPETGELDGTEATESRLRTYKGEFFGGTISMTSRLSAKAKLPARPEGWDFRELLVQSADKRIQKVRQSDMKDAA